MARKSRQSILKRQREVKRMEKAAQKRERRLARKQGREPSTGEPEIPRPDRPTAGDDDEGTASTAETDLPAADRP